MAIWTRIFARRFGHRNLQNLVLKQTQTPLKMSEPRWNSDMSAFREEFAKAKNIVVLTGAGVSAESGVPTFRGAGGYWRLYQAQDLATPEAFARNPSQVWEFYHYRREVMGTKEPNKAHLAQLSDHLAVSVVEQKSTTSFIPWETGLRLEAIAECEERLRKQDRRVTVITQNIDELHKRAGSQNVIELHGNLFTVRCVRCGTIKEDRNSPIVPALAGRGLPDANADSSIIPEKDLPRCQKSGCESLVRPHVVWFGESLEEHVLEQTHTELGRCDLCLVVGTSSVVYPAAMFAPMLANKGVTVAEFNTEETPATGQLKYHFHGPAGERIPTALARHPSEPE
ncbi:NAD-dependent protein deacylase sirtuin-5, mitochondrial [Holothuria leucospilota]|uniref:NAD-dependent protein deacylase n=1 Tax=Holothuria leucospilota TaxID=206669 RepID=A0A9Q0YPB8_HOLLE|nr:NAD-dependent protein deacylase sirtuin-5, mitochondrial [Holothuria leucospilota]